MTNVVYVTNEVVQATSETVSFFASISWPGAFALGFLAVAAAAAFTAMVKYY